MPPCLPGSSLKGHRAGVLFPSMPTISRTYDACIRLLRRLSPLFARGTSKVAVGIRGRREALDTLRGWGQDHRDSSRPLVWMHAPSVGEGLQAHAVLSHLLELRPDLQSAFTHFSPSAVDLARRIPAQIAGYLPWDVYSDMSELLSVLTPDLLAFTKTEVWPGVASAAATRAIPVVLVAATLPANAGRLRFPSRRLLRPTFESLTRVLAVSEADAGRFLALGVPKDRIEVTGDPGIDSAWERSREANRRAPYLSPFLDTGRPTLVAGSTWGADEEELVPALVKLREHFPTLLTLVAPHEPDEAHLRKLEDACGSRKLKTERLRRIEARGGAGPAAADVVLIDRVGILAHLYTVGDAAYVGGGFHRFGLHSVLEPAAAGLPVLFGPRHRNSQAAADLLAEGGGRVARDSGQIVEHLQAWLGDRSLLEETGRRASEYIEAHRGASRRTARALAEYLPTSNAPRAQADRVP